VQGQKTQVNERNGKDCHVAATMHDRKNLVAYTCDSTMTNLRL